MRCPNCEKELRRVPKDGKCSSCRTEITMLEVDGENVIIEDDEEVIKALVYDVLYSDGIVKCEKHKTENRFILTFTRTMRDKWIRCPACLSKDFMNMTVRGSLERKCHKCKAITIYIFE